MNKGEFVSFLASKAGCTKTEAEKSLDLVTDGIIAAVKKKHDISLVGFGSFSIKDRKAKEGRNPKTGAKIKIPAHKYPAFKPGKQLKDACN